MIQNSKKYVNFHNILYNSFFFFLFVWLRISPILAVNGISGCLKPWDVEHFQPLQIFVRFEKWTIHFIFYLPTFSNTLSNRLFILFSIAFKYYIFILSLIFLFQSSFIHLILMRSAAFLTFYNIFTINYMW